MPMTRAALALGWGVALAAGGLATRWVGAAGCCAQSNSGRANREETTTDDTSFMPAIIGEVSAPATG